MKTFVVLGLVAAWAWIGMQSPSSNPAVKDNRNAAKSAQDAKNHQSSAAVSPSPAPRNAANGDKDQTGSPQSNDGKGSISAQTVTIDSDREHPIWGTTVKDGWDKALVLGTLGLVVVGGFGIMYAIRTLKAIERQAELQEANLAQWVDLEPRGLLVETTSKTNPPKEVTLNLRWKVLNNTPFPFALQKVEVKVAIGLDWEHFEAVAEDTVAPAKSSHNYFDFMVPFRLTKGQTKSFFEGGVPLSITMRVSCIDASGYGQEQYFGDLYHCTFPDRMEITESLGGMRAAWIRTEKGDPKPDIVLSRSKILGVPDKDPEPPENPN
jgi:hypothetical protein